jgi:hypothetical protein
MQYVVHVDLSTLNAMKAGEPIDALIPAEVRNLPPGRIRFVIDSSPVPKKKPLPTTFDPASIVGRGQGGSADNIGLTTSSSFASSLGGIPSVDGNNIPLRRPQPDGSLAAATAPTLPLAMSNPNNNSNSGSVPLVPPGNPLVTPNFGGPAGGSTVAGSTVPLVAPASGGGVGSIPLTPGALSSGGPYAAGSPVGTTNPGFTGNPGASGPGNYVPLTGGPTSGLINGPSAGNPGAINPSGAGLGNVQPNNVPMTVGSPNNIPAPNNPPLGYGPNFNGPQNAAPPYMSSGNAMPPARVGAPTSGFAMMPGGPQAMGPYGQGGNNQSPANYNNPSAYPGSGGGLGAANAGPANIGLVNTAVPASNAPGDPNAQPNDASASKPDRMWMAYCLGMAGLLFSNGYLAYMFYDARQRYHAMLGRAFALSPSALAAAVDPNSSTN